MRMITEVIIISRKDKFEERMRNNPTPNDIDFGELTAYLLGIGFSCSPNSNNSHCVFYGYSVKGDYVSVSVANPHGTSGGVKAPYIRRVVNAIDKMRSRE